MGTPPGETYSFTGDHYRLVDAPALPKPVQVPGPPIIVGGRGPKRTPELAARYADEFNMPFKSVADTAEAYDRVREACERTGRAESGRAPLVLSAGIVVAIGRTDAEAQRRAAPLHEKSALPPEDPVVGSPAQLVRADRRVRRDRHHPGPPAPDRLRRSRPPRADRRRGAAPTGRSTMTDVIDGTELGPVGQEIVYENDRVRVWHIRLEPGERQPLHRHDHPYLVVAIEGAKNVVQTDRRHADRRRRAHRRSGLPGPGRGAHADQCRRYDLPGPAGRTQVDPPMATGVPRGAPLAIGCTRRVTCPTWPFGPGADCCSRRSG